MVFEHERCIVYLTAGIENNAIVGHARIELPRATVSTTTGEEVHDIAFHRDFLDENEAMEFARERAIAWIDEHVESGTAD
ncbi:hypothetical protein B0G69_7516 [Paraburkholderia sp. RAU2J]|nr:hypothetical protein B0G69_7516 [Paraburkholderia sp. RAU2J]